MKNQASLVANDHDLIILTHHKCASNWLRAICRNLLKTGLINFDITGISNSGPQNLPDRKLPRVLLNVNARQNANEYFLDEPASNIHFVRDPRDAFVSNYFSWRYSHSNNNATISEFRTSSASMTIEEGMLEMVELFPMGHQLSGWTEKMWSGVTQVRYEDLLVDFPKTFSLIFKQASAGWPDTVAGMIKDKTTFSRMSGRKNGSEDPSSHFRKGKAGDWQNYFSDRLSDLFYTKYDWLGERLGYWSSSINTTK